MNQKTLEELTIMGACRDGLEYCRRNKQSIDTLYERLPYGDYLIWLAFEASFSFSKKAQKALDNLAKTIPHNDNEYRIDWADLTDPDIDLKDRKKIAEVFRKVVPKKKFITCVTSYLQQEREQEELWEQEQEQQLQWLEKD